MEGWWKFSEFDSSDGCAAVNTLNFTYLYPYEGESGELHINTAVILNSQWWATILLTTSQAFNSHTWLNSTCTEQENICCILVIDCSWEIVGFSFLHLLLGPRSKTCQDLW